jgi:hypothetical protein
VCLIFLVWPFETPVARIWQLSASQLLLLPPKRRSPRTRLPNISKQGCNNGSREIVQYIVKANEYWE